MSNQIIPLTNDYNQQFDCTLSIDGNNKVLTFFINYNETAGYWMMKISDPNNNGEVLLNSIPLLTGYGDVANILNQYEYLAIGSAYLLNISGSDQDYPDNLTLGTDWILVWGDTQT
jgi:hypothetical protein